MGFLVANEWTVSFDDNTLGMTVFYYLLLLAPGVELYDNV